jgi:predicted PurR-regulated permease PerM
MTQRGSERERFLLVLFYAILLLTGYLAFRIVAPFLSALVWAGVIAMVLNPVQRRLARRVGVTRAAAFTTMLAAFIIVGPAVGVLSVMVAEGTTLINRIQSGGYALPTSPELQQWYDRLRQQTAIPLPADLTSTLADAVKWVATYVAGRAGSILQNVASSVFQLFVMLFGLFYCLRDSERIVRTIRELLPFEPARREHMINQTYDLVLATVGSTFIVAIVQGSLTGIALGLLGFGSPVFWGVMAAFVSLIPVVGSGLIWGPAVVYLFSTGDIVRGVILVAVGVGVIGMADNILRPVLLSGRTTMHGLLVFISLLGGMAAFGFIGIVIGPVAIATLTTLLGGVMEPGPGDGPEADAP